MAAKRKTSASEEDPTEYAMRPERLPIAELTFDPANARKHPEGQLAKMVASLKTFGQRKAIVVQRDGMIVRAGNGTLEAAKRLGWTHLACNVVDEATAKAIAYAIADNRTSDLAEWDERTLADLLGGLDEDLRDAAGFDAADLEELADSLLDAEPAEVVEDEVPEDAPTRVQKGDVWQLGRHRVVCGDCTNDAVLDAAICGRDVSVALTDPPYGLGGGKESGKNDYGEFSDTLENVKQLAERWVPKVRSKVGALVFSPGVTRFPIYPEPDWVLCWFYGGGQMRSPWGFNCWQPFLCYGKDPSLRSGNGARPDAVNMNTPANAGDIDHPCPKPIKLWEWMIHRLHFDDSPILDPFMGSGTTVVVAEQMGRQSCGVELDPRYCDIILQRWEKLTGETAEKVGEVAGVEA